MNRDEMTIVFELMGVRIKGFGLNQSTKCPLAPWTHSKGRDKHPSLMAKAGDVALFKCWACYAQGTVKKLARLYGDNSGDYRAYEYACSVEGGNYNPWNTVANTTARYSERFKYVGKAIKDSIPKEMTEEDLKKFMAEVPKYALKRGMTIPEIIHWEVGYDSKEKRMVFPIRDVKGKCVGVSGRALVTNQKPKYKHYYGFKKERYLYGERFVNASWAKGTGYLVEGFFDVIFLSRQLKNVLGTMGTSLSDVQTEKIMQWFNEIILFPDMDGPGLKFFSEMGKRLFLKGIKVGVAGVKIKNYDEKLFAYEFEALPGLEGMDPGEFTKEQIEMCLNQIVWIGGRS